jgi:cytochrome d ubiquinol oxidase subunit II
MDLADLLLVILLTALTLYVLLGGADFGAGIWEFTSAFQSGEPERRQLYRAIGPVWEANHVWLIFVIVILANGFPLALAGLSRALWVPLLLALAGIVFRGASYAFRAGATPGERRAWEAVFAMASTATPFFLGAAAGAIAGGRLLLDADGSYRGAALTGWISPLAIFTGFYTVALSAWLTAVFLIRESRAGSEGELEELWRRRALSVGLWLGLLSAAGLVLVGTEAPELVNGFRQRGWPVVVVSVVCGGLALVAIARRQANTSGILACGAVAAVIWGWGLAQYPAIIPPAITVDLAKAPDIVLSWMLVVIVAGALLLFPSLVWLFRLFKASHSG